MVARPSVIPAVQERLEVFLNVRETEYLSQTDIPRVATLPSTPDGKVNVRAIAREIGLKVSQEKYLYERDALSSLINLMAEGQGLRPIGSRLTTGAGDAALKEQVHRQGQLTKQATSAAIEAQAANAELLERLRAAVAEIETLKSTNLRLQAQLDAVHAGVFIRVID